MSSEPPLSSQPSSPRYYPALDGLRGVSILLVLAGHFIPFLFHAYHPALASVGVRMFFVLSGFLITENLLILREGRSTSQYLLVFYSRRVLRIFPAYYVYLLVVFLIFGNQFNLFYPAVYITNIMMMFDGMTYGPLNHLWSLAVEEQFYLIWPFILLVARRHEPRWLIGMAILSLVLRSVFSLTDSYIAQYVFLLANLDCLALGGWAAWLHRSGRLSLLVKPVHAIIAFVFLAVVQVFHLHGVAGFLKPVLEPLLVGIITIVLIARSVLRSRVTRWLAFAPLMFIGRISYSLYLYHWLIESLLGERIPGLLGLSVKVFLSMIAALGSYYLVERPVLRLKNHPRLRYHAS